VKVTGRITPHYRALIEASPFLVLATVGPEGLDCSPRGDQAGFARIADDRTLIIPDRRGNNRIDSLRNIVRDPRVALLFLIPGSGTTFRVNGRAAISADANLLASLAVDGKAPRTAIIVTVEAAYFQCARAIVRSRLWDPAARGDPDALPSPGAILAALSAGEVGGPTYDAQWPARAAASLW
jgi:PPOX class probable FMN-dependent enzyme